MGKRNRHKRGNSQGSSDSHWGSEGQPPESAPSVSEAQAKEDALIEEVWASGSDGGAGSSSGDFDAEDEAWPDGPASSADPAVVDSAASQAEAGVSDERHGAASGDEASAGETPTNLEPLTEPGEGFRAAEADVGAHGETELTADSASLAAAMDAAEAGGRKRKAKRAKNGQPQASVAQTARDGGVQGEGRAEGAVLEESLPDNVLDLFGADGGDEAEALPEASDDAVDDELPLEEGLERLEGPRLESVIESLLFASDRLLNMADLRRLTNVRDTRKIQKAIDDLKDRCMDTGIILVEAAGSFRFQTNPQNADWVGRMVQGKPVRLSRAMMETLAIVAYKQPITRPEVDDIRGVDCGPVLKTLLERNLVRVIGKKEEVGRPLLYGTTPEFLKTFNLSDLTELPTLREFHELGAEESQKMKQTFGDGQAAEAAAEPLQAESTPEAAGGELAAAAAGEPGAPEGRAPGLKGDRPSAFSNNTIADVPEDESLIEELERATEAATRALEAGKIEPGKSGPDSPAT